MFHSTETTLLSIHNDLILAMDRGEVTFLILLDLSAAVDTVDHSILLHRRQHWFGLHGTSLDWFSSYLPHVLGQSPSKIPLHLSQIFLVVYLKVPSLAHFFLLFIQLLLALSSPRAQGLYILFCTIHMNSYLYRLLQIVYRPLIRDLLLLSHSQTYAQIFCNILIYLYHLFRNKREINKIPPLC